MTAIAYLPFRIVYHPTMHVGRAVAWLAQGYRQAPALERALIFPSWAVLRGLFLVGYGLTLALHAVAVRVCEKHAAPETGEAPSSGPLDP